MKTITVQLKGSITIGQGDIKLREGIQNIMEQGYEAILLDLSDVHYMDSSGLGELVAAHEHAVEKGLAIGIFGINPKIEKLLYVSLLLDKLNCFQSAEEAMAQWLAISPR